MTIQKKFFSVEEANALIPQLDKLFDEIFLIKKEIESRIPELKPIISKVGLNGWHKETSKHVNDLGTFNKLVNSVLDLGCLIKDINIGLIDFPHLKDGKEVYLCWKKDEDKISFWHEIEAGFAGRKPIDDKHNLVD